MTGEQGKKEVSAENLAILQQKALFAEGELHAFLFARHNESDLSLINAEVQELNAAEDHLTSHLKTIASDNMNAPDYQRGYQSGLERAAQLILSADMPARATLSPKQQAFVSDGRKEAFHFALEKQGDLLQLQTEIERVKDVISIDLARNPHGAMSPNASPRLYRDGYLSGLQEAIEIVTHASAAIDS